MNPKLSVIIASYNHEEYIVETLKSIENQTFQDFEIIMVDDGSKDGTVEAARGVNSRAIIYTQPNLGVVAARNRGVDMAKGQYICFVDSDDVIMHNRFERQVSILDGDKETGLVFADALIIDSDSKEIGRFSDVYPVIPGDTDEMLFMHYCFTPMITVMVRAEVLRKAGPFEKPGPISDYIKWIQVSHLSKCYYDPTALGCWRRHQRSTSKSANKVKSYAKTRAALKKTLRKYPDLRIKLGRKVSKRFSRSYFLSAFWLAADGDVVRARKYYYKALKINPVSFENWGGFLLSQLPARNMIIKLHQYVRAKKLPW